MKIPPLRGVAVALAGVGLLAIPSMGQAQGTPVDPLRALRQALELRESANERGAEVQNQIATLSEETDALYARYQNAFAQLESLRKFNDGMRNVIGEQDIQIAGLTHQLDQVDEVARSVTPLMFQMIDALERFISLDIPFLEKERVERVGALRTLMHRADVTVSEKYRRIMEAYQIENEYGRTIEAYRAPLEAAGGETVDLLRFGRISLVYLSLDLTKVGAWDPRERAWKPLDSSFISDVRTGLRIARQQVAPDLMQIPLPGPIAREGEG